LFKKVFEVLRLYRGAAESVQRLEISCRQIGCGQIGGGKGAVGRKLQGAPRGCHGIVEVRINSLLKMPHFQLPKTSTCLRSG
jgi:hypothetical protein